MPTRPHQTAPMLLHPAPTMSVCAFEQRRTNLSLQEIIYICKCFIPPTTKQQQPRHLHTILPPTPSHVEMLALEHPMFRSTLPSAYAT